MEDAECGSDHHQRNEHRDSDPEVCYQCLFEHNSEPMVVLDAAGVVIASNRIAKELLGLRPGGTSSLIAEQFSSQADAAADEEMSQLFCDVQKMGSARWQFELPDADRIMEARISCLPEGSLTSGGFLWSAYDVTERARLEQTRQELVNMLVHDLRVPLGNIQNSLDLVITAWRERDVTLPIDQVLQIGQRSAQRMERLISDILDSARLQAQERTLNVTFIEVGALVDEAVETVTGSAQRRKQTLRVQVEPDLPLMEGDVDLLRRVLVNLVSNAVRYTQEEGEITVSAALELLADEPAGDKAVEQFRFTVKDNGPGIAPRVQEHLFRLFYRGDSTLVKSAGIGLAFCKLAVEAHGGRIWVESELGSGSTFTFTIPRPLPRHAYYYQEGS
jgi:signal transduction histidine kinase